MLERIFKYRVTCDVCGNTKVFESSENGALPAGWRQGGGSGDYFCSDCWPPNASLPSPKRLPRIDNPQPASDLLDLTQPQHQARAGNAHHEVINLGGIVNRLNDVNRVAPTFIVFGLKRTDDLVTLTHGRLFYTGCPQTA